MSTARLVATFAALALAGGCVRREAIPSPTGARDQTEPLAFALPLYESGKVHDLASDVGSVVLLDVWATWCEPCRDALPLYDELLKEYGPRGLRAYAINIDVDQNEIPRFLQETKVSMPILLDRKAEVSEGRLKVRMMPSTFLLDRQGRVRFSHEGFAEEFLAQYQAEIEQLLAEPAP